MGLALMKGIPVHVLGEGIDECLFVEMPQVIRGFGDLLVSPDDRSLDVE